MKFTVIIPTRNRDRSALELLFYLRRSLEWGCPIVVVDQSDDRGKELANQIKDSQLNGILHFVHNQRGTSAGRNQGARLAATDWLLFLDDDVRPAAGYLESVTNYLKQNPWIDAVQPGLEQQVAWQQYRKDPKSWNRQRLDVHVRLPESEDKDGVLWFTSSAVAGFETATIGIASGNFAISRAAYFGAGGFDEQMEGLGEDREFGLRLWWYGYRVYLYPQAVAFHLRESAGGLRYRKSRLSRIFDPEPAVGSVYFYLKWFPGKPYRRMIGGHFWKQWKRPWVAPLKVIRLYRAIAQAKRRLARGAVYLAKPRPRFQVIGAPGSLFQTERRAI
ncbi:MAG TPA: glycosyltransferase [Candidatus Binatia bacterium]|jgi:GT2 family glycosyltransferase|nr:glycosyltransferase [Candidatus Binatia bacterium]